MNWLQTKKLISEDVLPNSELNDDYLYYLYSHIRLDTNKVFYIGIGTNNKRDSYYRANQKTQRNKYWTNIVNKTDYKINIICHCKVWEDICEKEKEFIKLYGRKDLNLGSLCNFTDGGEGRFGKQLDVSIGEREKFNTKRLENLRKVWVGKKHSQETIDIIKFKNKGQKRTEEAKLKMSLSRKGIIRTPAKKINQFTKNGEFIKTWDSSKMAAEELNFKYAGIINACKNNKLYYDYKWKKYED